MQHMEMEVLGDAGTWEEAGLWLTVSRMSCLDLGFEEVGEEWGLGWWDEESVVR